MVPFVFYVGLGCTTSSRIITTATISRLVVIVVPLAIWSLSISTLIVVALRHLIVLALTTA